MQVVGQSVVRLDGRDKVTGKAIYVDDITLPDMWYGAVVRSAIPSGRVLSVNFNPSFNWNEVVVADRNDIRGSNVIAMIEEDLPLLVYDEIKHIGEAIVLIAASTKEIAQEATRHVEIKYEEWEPILSIEDSKAGKRIIHGSNNIISHYEIKKRDVEDGFKEADHIIEGVYRTHAQEHAYIEPQGIVAMPRAAGGVDIIGSLQCPFYVLSALKKLHDLSDSQISIKQATIGGAFGGKEDYPSILAGYASVLALKAGRPIKMVYARGEDMNVTTKRHPSIVRHKTGVKKDGTLVAMEIEVEFDAGAYTTLSPVVLSRGFLHSTGPYRCPNVKASATAYATNTPPNGAFRGFGAPQTLFAIEAHMDKIAEALSMPPYELRKLNCFRIGDETATGQILKESVGALECLEKAATASDFERKWRESKGIGLSLFMHGGGFTGSGEAYLKSKAGIRLEKNGEITILTGCTDMGQGAHTVLPQIVAEVLQVPLEKVKVETPDTSKVPNSGPTVASRTTMVIGKILYSCAEKLKRKLAEGKVDRPFTIIETYELAPGISWDDATYHGDAYASYSWGCNVAEVEVDPNTFEIKVEKMYMAQDIGKAVNPQMAEGQIEGGTLQAVGWALLEDQRYNKGKLQNNRFQTYIIPTALDAPALESIIVENPFSHGPMGAKGLGELPHDGAAPAIVNAIANATGIRITELPVTSEKLYEAFRK